MNDVLNNIMWNIYGRPVNGKPGITFDTEDFENEKVRRKNFKNLIRVLVEHEIKRHYDIIP
jgi:hypothetical protein